MTVHGTVAGYSSGCRDDACRAAKAAHEAARRAKYRNGPHGLNRYSVGCRCDVCRTAKAAQRVRDREADNARRRDKYDQKIDPALVDRVETFRARNALWSATEAAERLCVPVDTVRRIWDRMDALAGAS